MTKNATSPTRTPTVRPASRCPTDSAVEMNELVLPTHSNALGTIFGGQVMAWIDVCAAMAAQRHARRIVVTASMDKLDFIAPIKVGHVVNLRGMVNLVGRTSMEVGVRVEAEDPLTGIRNHAASAYLTFVALGSDGQPASVPALDLTTDDQRRRHAAATRRRELRRSA